MRIAVVERPDGGFGEERLLMLDGERRIGLDDFPALLPRLAYDQLGNQSPAGGLCSFLEGWNSLDADFRPEMVEWARGGQEVWEERLLAPLVDRARVLIAGSRRFDAPLRDNAPMVAMLKYKSAFADPGATVELPPEPARWEVDAVLGAVIGRRIFRLDAAAAADAISGFVLIADVTDSDRFVEEARTNNGLMAKNHRAASCIGPAIWCPEDPAAMPSKVEMRVNGELQQSFALADLFWGFGEFASRWSAATLLPGDVIGLGPAAFRTGHGACPAAPLAPGDEVEIVCPEIGALCFSVGGR